MASASDGTGPLAPAQPLAPGEVCLPDSVGGIQALFRLCCPEALPWPALNSIPVLAVVNLRASKVPASSQVGNWPVSQGLWSEEGLGQLIRCVRCHSRVLDDGDQNPRKGGRPSTPSGESRHLYSETWESTLYVALRLGWGQRPSAKLHAWGRLTNSQSTFI